MEGARQHRTTAWMQEVEQCRSNCRDRSHQAHTYHTTLGELEEAVVVSLRETLFLPLDDLLYVTQT